MPIPYVGDFNAFPNPITTSNEIIPSMQDRRNNTKEEDTIILCGSAKFGLLHGVLTQEITIRDIKRITRELSSL